MSNHRHQSILPIFSKGFEVTLYKSMNTIYKKVTSSQYDFPKGTSTESALIPGKKFEEKDLRKTRL